MNGTIFKLQSLIVDRNDLSKEHSAFNKSLVSCLKMSRLKQLSFASCKLHPTIVEALGEGMKINRLLEHLCLRDNFISIDSLAPFFEACIANAGIKLQHLDLSCNQLCDMSGSVISFALKKVTTLESLNLRDNQLGP